MGPETRASDNDRQRTIAALQRHTEVGRLSLDEFSDRVGAVCSARTLGDLAHVTRDLPAEPVVVPAVAGIPRRELPLAFLAAVVTLLLLAVFMGVTRGG